MPLFYYACPACENRFPKLLSPDKAKEPQICPKCQKQAERAPQAPTTQVMEKIDNGLMARAVERPADAERIFKDRSMVDYEEQAAVRQDFKKVDK